jgi:hypothetical protein
MGLGLEIGGWLGTIYVMDVGYRLSLKIQDFVALAIKIAATRTMSAYADEERITDTSKDLDVI